MHGSEGDMCNGSIAHLNLGAHLRLQHLGPGVYLRLYRYPFSAVITFVLGIMFCSCL